MLPRISILREYLFCIRALEVKRMSRHSGSEGFELHSPLQDVQVPGQISSSDRPNECQIGWEQVLVDHWPAFT